MDGLLQPRIGGLYHGVSRQAPLQRSPSQMQDLDNFLPSVDIGGIVDRNGTQAIFALPAAPYLMGATQHFFRTTDGQRWVLIRRTDFGGFDVRNVDTGVQAAVTMSGAAPSYLAYSANLRFLSLADTTFILNPDVVVTATEVPVPAISAVYIWVRRVSAAQQTYSITTPIGAGIVTVPLNANYSRDWVAQNLAANLAASAPSLGVYPIAPSVIRIQGPTDVLAQIWSNNDWDETAILTIKGRVSATSDLPPTFDPGVPVAVDLGNGDLKSSYYVSYDATTNLWVECSYLPNKQTTASLNAATMPVRLHQVGTSSFELVPCDWVARKTGDANSNPVPFFVGKRITALAQWKGRLWLAADDTSLASQPDDLYNFFRDSAREEKPSDPVELPADAPDLSTIEHVIPFRNKLIVTSDNAQLEVPGDKPITPTDATIGVATRYQLDKDCQPVVVGDSMYYSGQAENRSALWEYSYDEGSAGNTAFDLSKHVPGYIPGSVRKIRGSSQSGRMFVWTPSDPARLYVHTSYWTDTQRAQNAWNLLSFPGVTSILDFWVDRADLIVLCASASFVWVVRLPVDPSLANGSEDARTDFTTTVPVTWNATRNRSEVILPVGYMDLASQLVLLVTQDSGLPYAFTGTVVSDGVNNILYFTKNTGQTTGRLGIRYERSATFSPFYPTIGESVTPMGRLQVRNVVLDTLVACDFTATVTRPDRTPTQVSLSPRVVGDALVPVLGNNQQHRIPFNSKGDQATLKVSTTSTGPLAITGFTLMARYTNPFAQ